MNLPRGKQSGINYGQKKQQGQSDIEQLIDIQRYLITRYKLKVKIELLNQYKLFFDDFDKFLIIIIA